MVEETVDDDMVRAARESSDLLTEKQFTTKCFVLNQKLTRDVLHEGFDVGALLIVAG